MDNRLSSWFRIWHRRYRPVLLVSLATCLAGAALVYVDDALLSWLTAALSGGAENGNGVVPGLVRGLAAGTLGVILILLVLFVINRLLLTWVGYVQAVATGRMTIACKSDLEREVLDHLLRQDDAFFSTHSPAETVNRLSVDLQRIAMRRPNLMMLWWGCLLILGNVAFFAANDWRLALLAAAGCAAGGAWATGMSQPVRRTDARFLREDDAVKARFEDYLRAYQEVQIGRLQGRVLDNLAEAQSGRTGTFLRYVKLNELVNVGNVISNMLALVAMLGVIVYKHATGNQSAALMLVPVVVHALPYLFKNSAKVIQLAFDFQLAATSIKRILEYEFRQAGEGEPPAGYPEPSLAPVPITVRDCTFQYTAADGTRQGGVSGVSTSFTPGRWVAIVGGAGSGKSTLVKLVLGQLKPQDGQVLYGPTPLAQVAPAVRAGAVTLMPQSPALLDTTIEQNVLFGRPGGDWHAALSADDLDVIERSGLGRVCRLKALDLVPQGSAAPGELAERIGSIRARLRQRLESDCGLTPLPYETGHADPHHWRLEALLGGRCDRARVLAILAGKHAAARLARALAGPLGQQLADEGRTLVRETRRLLELDSLHVYGQLAAFPLDERVWQWRRSCRHLADGGPISPGERATLGRIGLTGSLGEQPGPLAPVDDPDARGAIEELFRPAWQPFDVARIHPHLSWRENLVFGLIEAASSRNARLVDQTILQFIEDERLADAFTRVGLAFRIGRLGSNLSGGQGQMVVLCRALLRRTAVLVLDEPTSALDPASRTRVAELLRAWKSDRLVLTISHDAEFVRQADEVRLMDGGRLAASGTFEQLGKESEIFRRTLRQP